ncbi:hypothetical protein BSKO_00265 [Bryopsis sp. KO-2023]|nr:hypothetical protein BSKO_00265 [Bryopsis sp. KO-2023]
MDTYALQTKTRGAAKWPRVTRPRRFFVAHCDRQGRVARRVAFRVCAFDSTSLQNNAMVAVRVPATEKTTYAWREDFHEQYEWKKKLNAGSFGEVWLATDQRNDELVAVKELEKRRGRLTPERVRQKVEQELRVMTDVGDCPVVVKLEGGFKIKGHYEIVMEYCDGEDLKVQLAENGPVSEQLCAAVVHEILKVIKACHEKGIVHGDIKTANFMIKSPKCNPFSDPSTSTLEPGWLKAIDFGCSQYFKGDDYRIRHRVGTPVYMAPEVFQRNFGFECDMWSLGVVMFQLLACSFPFWRSAEDALMCSVREVSHAVQTANVDFASQPVWRSVSPECKDFVMKLLRKDYTRRMTVEEAQNHPFLKQSIQLDEEGRIMLGTNNIVNYVATKQASKKTVTKNMKCAEKNSAC